MPAMGSQAAAVLAGLRWLLAIPDAIEQLEEFDRELTPATRPTSSSASRLEGRRRAAVRGEEARRKRVVTEVRKARLTGIRVTVPVAPLEARAFQACPRARVGEGRGAALRVGSGPDDKRFEALVVRGDPAGGGGEVREEPPDAGGVPGAGRGACSGRHPNQQLTVAAPLCAAIRPPVSG